MSNEISELMILYDMLSFSCPEKNGDLMQEIIEKSTRLLGASRLALVIGEGEQRKCLGSWGFRDEKDVWKKIMENGEDSFQYPFLNGSKGFLYFQQTRPLTDRDRRLYTVFARRIEDLVERKGREEQLRRITENMLDMISQADAEGVFLYVSPSSKNILGYQPEEMLGKSLLTFVHDEDRARVVAAMKKAMKTLSPGRVEYRLRHAKGDYLWLESVGNPLLDEYGRFSGTIFGSRDISERKQAEEKLKQNISKLKEIVEGIIQAMAITVEMRDPYTAGHQRRVTRLALAIAQEMKVPEEKLEGIRLAAAIHDIGKIYVPAEILSKPGDMNEIELNLIRTHSNVGYDILKRIDFPWPIAEIVVQHHERMDCSGYPFGLPGGKILLEARILAVADVVEAMASHRPYRPALGAATALEEIKKNSGKLYDPQVVEACLRVFEKGFVFE